jgi:hypothetical protein
MTLKPVLALVAAAIILSSSALMATPAHAQRGYYETYRDRDGYDYDGYRRGSGYDRGYQRDYRYRGRSSAVEPGSEACLRDPAYRMDPRCYDDD